MQNAQASFLKTVKELIEEDEIEKAFEVLEQLDTDWQIGIENDLILQRGRYKSNEKDWMRGIGSADDYKRTRAQIRYNLVTIVDGVPRKLQLNQQIKGVMAMNFSVPDDGRLEKVLGDKSRLVKINWLEKAVKASKSVGRIVLPDGSTGTGFLVQGGYIFTNNHVIPTVELAAAAYVEFNFEEDAFGQAKTRHTYSFDETTFITDKALDYTRLKVLENNNKPLSDWGFLELAPDARPLVGDPVNIIQHPNGDSKQIALTSNDVLSIWGPRLFYRADTEPGSSGSPVFNQDWKVVALHHAGKLMSEGGLQINQQGERASANRGILLSFILEHIAKG